MRLRNEGLSFYEIIKKFKTKDNRFLFTSSVVQREIQRLVEEEKVELTPRRKEKIDKWYPQNLNVGRGTVWSFRNRGSWGVHKGDYRGNWPPEIPHILIERYTKVQDVVVDPFAGGGTTLIEAWSANRRSYGIDINPAAISITNSRLQEMAEQASNDKTCLLRKDLRPIVIQGDSRNLTKHMNSLGISDGSVKLICTHPPYLDSLKVYTFNGWGLVSHLRL